MNLGQKVGLAITGAGLLASLAMNIIVNKEEREFKERNEKIKKDIREKTYNLMQRMAEHQQDLRERIQKSEDYLRNYNIVDVECEVKD